MGAGWDGMYTGGTGKNFGWWNAWKTLGVVWKTGNIVINITEYFMDYVTVAAGYVKTEKSKIRVI